MKILSIELQGYLRLSLSNIQYIKIDFNEKIQLILGSNGSGKSSILRELSPLPAKSSDYEKNGFKVIVIENKGLVYTLSSRFSPKQEHSFIVDGEELNKGGTASVQNELVKQIFGITMEIHELLLSSDSLSSMSISDRRKWFTSMSNTNYDYALSVYNRAKEKHRDLVGAVKLLKNRLTQERSASYSAEEVKLVESDAIALKSALDELYTLRVRKDVSTSDLESNLTSRMRDIHNLCNLIATQTVQFKRLNDGEFNDRESLVEHIRTLEKIVNESKGKRVFIVDEMRKLESSISNMGNISNVSMDSLVSEIKQINAEIYAIRRGYRSNLDDSKAADVLKTIDSISDQYVSILVDLPINSGQYTRSGLLNDTDTLTNISKYLSDLSVELDKVNNKIKQQEEMKNHNAVTCPNCKHRWSIGYDEKLYQSLLAKTDELSLIISTKEKEKELLADKVADTTQYFDKLRMLRTLFNNAVALSFVTDEIISSNLVLKDPKQIIRLMEEVRVDAISGLPVANLLNRVKTLEQQKALMESNDVSRLDEYRTNLTILESNLATINSDIFQLERKIAKYEDLVQYSYKIEQLTKDLLEVIASKNTLTAKIIDSYYSDAVDKVFYEVQNRLTKVEDKLAQLTNKSKTIADLESQIEQYSKDEIYYKEVIRVLSPTNGLIAEGLTKFIKQFIVNMNYILEKIWSYRLEILPCEIDAENNFDLDYKFKVLVGDNGEISDISKGSSAMKEVIDLAFKLVAMKYLNLQTHPVYLDEFAKTLDYEHRKTAHKTIVDLITNANFSQLFIINHYNDLYGGLVNSEITVLHSANIVMPAQMVNTHVVMR
jgi:DNA repair exonuclease SbcCD ATPase subunit